MIRLLRKLFFPYPSEDWDYMWSRCLAAIYGMPVTKTSRMLMKMRDIPR